MVFFLQVKVGTDFVRSIVNTTTDPVGGIKEFRSVVGMGFGSKYQRNEQQENVKQCSFVAYNKVNDLLHARILLKDLKASSSDPNL